MKNLFLLFSFLFVSFTVQSQCSGGSSTGTHNDCYLNTSRQANINLLNVDSVLPGAKWYGVPIDVAHGGTGLATMGSVGQMMRVNAAGTATEWFTPIFLTSFTESDPVFMVSAAASISATNIVNWSAAYSWGNHSAAGYLYASDTTAMLSKYVRKTLLTSTLSNYITSGAMAAALSNYVTNTSLSTTLGNYVTNSSLSTTLGNYVTSTALAGSLSAYVTNSSLSTTLSGYATTTALTTGLAGKFNNPNGTNSQYIRGDGSLATFPSSGLPALGTAGQLLRVNAGGTALEYFTASYITGNQTITFSGDVTGSGATSIITALSNTDVVAGNYDWVTVDAKGRVTAGGSMSDPIAIASGARSFSTVYQVSTSQSEITLSASCTVALGVLGNGTGTVYVEVSANGTTGWTYYGQITKNSANLIGLTSSNGGSITVSLKPGWRYRMVTTSSSSGLGNTVSFSFDGGSYVTF